MSCKQPTKEKVQPEQNVASEVVPETMPRDTPKVVAVKPFNPPKIETGATTPAELLAYARTLTGTTYKYGSTDPQQGFDCSGFITHVFNHFDIAVPRSSVDFTDVEREVELSAARPGDLILFTGTDSTTRIVGHMGIISDVESGEMSFIHSSSGKANGVTITPLNEYYMGRFMKIIRIFPQNDGV
ncbi:C40 family peptidase [Segetibacter sp. 3557_3]|uniref:C40 family peptidase n=1 Tax=Segetibacter sp. 3557_3 TaxID=2547429 RepID=UPI001404F1BB|nr:C40 family peptidase [Segetibacter sp. 3557_3]